MSIVGNPSCLLIEKNMQSNTDYHIFTLSNGLRCVHWRLDGEVSYCGVAVNAGSRDEPTGKEGLAHFVEHTLFKGTSHRRAVHISNRMESVGGELNAFTGKEETMLYTNAPTGNLERSCDLLADIIGYSNFPGDELDKEREVVIEEINSYLDSPSDLVFDNFEDAIFAGSRLGHNILGDQHSVEGLHRADCRDFIDKFYVPSNMALYIADPSAHDKVEKIITRYFSFMHHAPAEADIRHQPAVAFPFNDIREQDGHQANTIVGTRTFGRRDERRYALMLLNNYLGGPSMNSRLNQELREKRGYVYSADSSLALFSDCGLLEIYFACDPDRVNQCRRIAMHELEKLASTTLTDTAFERMRRQFVGQLQVSTDNRENRAMQLAKSLLYYGAIHDIDHTRRHIMNLTAADIRREAESLLASKFSTLTLR